MADLNRVILAGRLTRDPEVRYTPSGTAVADLGVAISDAYRNRAGEIVEQTCFVDVVVWGRQAETTGEYLSKGSPLLIEGRLQLDQWENQQGEKRSKLRVKADRVQFLGSPRREAEMGDAPAERDPDRERAPVDAAPPPGDEPASRDEDDLPF
jgi:single-strand DNA-binding protein